MLCRLLGIFKRMYDLKVSYIKARWLATVLWIICHTLLHMKMGTLFFV